MSVSEELDQCDNLAALGCANDSWSSANRNKSRLFDLQAESLGSLSPGQRPGNALGYRQQSCTLKSLLTQGVAPTH